MSGLFIRLYLDEDVDVLVADLVRARGFEVSTTVGAGNRGADDAAQLSYATAHDRAIVTHNRADFETLARHWVTIGRSHAGIIIAVRRPVHAVTSRLLALLDDVSGDEMRDQLRYI